MFHAYAGELALQNPMECSLGESLLSASLCEHIKDTPLYQMVTICFTKVIRKSTRASKASG
jgi:hypothetical protein